MNIDQIGDEDKQFVDDFYKFLPLIVQILKPESLDALRVRKLIEIKRNKKTQEIGSLAYLDPSKVSKEVQRLIKRKKNG